MEVNADNGLFATFFFHKIEPQLKMQSTAVLKSKRNLTRFTYKTTAFQGWRLCISRGGHTFRRYFSDKDYGGGKGALRASETCLKQLLEVLDGSRIINGKLSQTAIAKGEKVLKEA